MYHQSATGCSWCGFYVAHLVVDRDVSAHRRCHSYFKISKAPTNPRVAPLDAAGVLSF